MRTYSFPFIIYTIIDFADLFGRIQDSIMPGDFCGDSSAQNDMEIILIIDEVEKEVAKIYNELVTAAVGDRGEQYRALLVLYASVRTDLDEVLSKVSSEEDLQAQQRVIRTSLGVASSLLMTGSQQCARRCRPSSCQSCGHLPIQEVRQVVTSYTAPAQQRTDLIHLVDTYNGLARHILRQKTLGNEIADCDLEKERVWAKLK